MGYVLAAACEWVAAVLPTTPPLFPIRFEVSCRYGGSYTMTSPSSSFSPAPPASHIRPIQAHFSKTLARSVVVAVVSSNPLTSSEFSLSLACRFLPLCSLIQKTLLALFPIKTKVRVTGRAVMRVVQGVGREGYSAPRHAPRKCGCCVSKKVKGHSVLSPARRSERLLLYLECCHLYLFLSICLADRALGSHSLRSSPFLFSFRDTPSSSTSHVCDPHLADEACF